jgi:beta-lactamase class A
MLVSLPRRQFTQFLTAASIATLISPVSRQAMAKQSDIDSQILDLFQSLPGKTAVKLKTVNQNQVWDVSLAPELPLFCGSAFKVYVLTVFLRQMEQGKVSLTDVLRVDDQVRVLSSPVFETLTGETTALIALEAMIMHSDNTATDLILAQITPQAVREFIQSIGLKQTFIPDSINTMLSYLLGAKSGQDWGWAKIKAMADKNAPTSRPIINNQQTMTASAQDFVTFYEQALQGAFFTEAKTLNTFKRMLTLPSILWDFIPPGAFGYVKGGSIDWPPQYALCVAGGVSFRADCWTYYTYLINWDEPHSKQTALVANQFLAAVKTSLELVRSTVV